MDYQEIALLLSEMIETKINKRNKEAIHLPKNEGLINYFDAEIDKLEKIEKFMAEISMTHARLLVVETRAAFARGVKSGKLEMETGRPHPEYLFK